jgi:hypothetical protein
MSEEMHDAELDDLHLKAPRLQILAASRSGADIIRFELYIRQLWLLMLGDLAVALAVSLSFLLKLGGWRADQVKRVSVMWCLAD